MELAAWLFAAYCEEKFSTRKISGCLRVSTEDIVNALGVINRKTPVGELIAQKLIELAKAGERESESLKELTIEAVRSSIP